MNYSSHRRGFNNNFPYTVKAVEGEDKIGEIIRKGRLDKFMDDLRATAERFSIWLEEVSANPVVNEKFLSKAKKRVANLHRSLDRAEERVADVATDVADKAGLDAKSAKFNPRVGELVDQVVVTIGSAAIPALIGAVSLGWLALIAVLALGVYFLVIKRFFPTFVTWFEELAALKGRAFEVYAILKSVEEEGRFRDDDMFRMSGIVSSIGAHADLIARKVPSKRDAVSQDVIKEVVKRAKKLSKSCDKVAKDINSGDYPELDDFNDDVIEPMDDLLEYYADFLIDLEDLMRISNTAALLVGLVAEVGAGAVGELNLKESLPAESSGQIMGLLQRAVGKGKSYNATHVASYRAYAYSSYGTSIKAKGLDRLEALLPDIRDNAVMEEFIKRVDMLAGDIEAYVEFYSEYFDEVFIVPIAYRFYEAVEANKNLSDRLRDYLMNVQRGDPNRRTFREDIRTAGAIVASLTFVLLSLRAAYKIANKGDRSIEAQINRVRYVKGMVADTLDVIESFDQREANGDTSGIEVEYEMLLQSVVDGLVDMKSVSSFLNQFKREFKEDYTLMMNLVDSITAYMQHFIKSNDASTNDIRMKKGLDEMLNDLDRLDKELVLFGKKLAIIKNKGNVK